MTIYFKNKNGAALIIVLMAFTIMFVLGITALFISSNSLFQIKDDKSEVKAKFLAESGLDATVEYLNRTTGSFVNEIMPTVYFDKGSSTFTTAMPTAANLVGSVQTTVNYNDGVCTVTSVANTNGETYTAVAASTKIFFETVGPTVPSGNIESTNNWYYCRLDPGYWQNRWPWPDIWHPPVQRYLFYGNRANQVTMTGSDNVRRIVSYHYLDGVSVIETPNDSVYPLELASTGDSEAHRRIGYGARALFFRCPIQLEAGANASDSGFFVAAAETIVFDNTIYITRDHTGVLILNLPDGFGIPGEVVYQNVPNGEKSRIVLGQKYGKVYFNDVYVDTGTSTSRNDTLSNKSFYFRIDPAHPDQGLPIEYDDGNGNSFRYSVIHDSRSLLIPATMSTIPDPSDMVKFKFVQ